MIGILHTTESDPGTFRGVANFFDRNPDYQPHVLYDPSTRENLQFLAANEPAKALYNAPGGVETNRRPGGVFQVEIVGRAADVGHYDSEWYAALQAFLVQWSTLLGIPYIFYQGPRLTFQEWNGPLQGWFGHCHVPENNHSDPGTLDYDRLRIPLQPKDPDPDMDLTDKLTSGYNVNDTLNWTLEGVNKLLARTAAPAPSDLTSVPTHDLLAEVARRLGA